MNAYLIFLANNPRAVGLPVTITGKDFGPQDALVLIVQRLVKKFAFVFFCPGNHELWIRKNRSGTAVNSHEKWKLIRELSTLQSYQKRIGWHKLMQKQKPKSINIFLLNFLRGPMDSNSMVLLLSLMSLLAPVTVNSVVQHSASADYDRELAAAQKNRGALSF